MEHQNDQGIVIDFSLDEYAVRPGTVEFDLPRRLKFWDEIARPWLLERGYVLFKFEPYDKDTIWGCHCFPTTSSVPTDDALPFAVHDDLPFDVAESRKYSNYYDPSDASTMGRVVFAQDKEDRHVAIKLVRSGSEESRILHLLFDSQKLHDGGMIPGILPILALLPFGGHWLVFMPRWGDTVGSPWFESMQEILVLIRGLLEGLSHIHSFKIVHRDVDTYNMLVNHVQLIDETSQYCIRPQMRREGRMKYVLFDFDLSLLLPPETRIESCRRPYLESVVGHDTPIPDVRQGEYEYNPFAYDVGCLGEFLCFRFQHLTPLAPMLAPLFDSMVHWNVESRFTAAQALQFFDDMYPHLEEEQLESSPPEYDLITHRPYEEHDRWAGLPKDFVMQWSHMRMPKVPIMIKLLRLICKPRFGAALVRTLRRMIDNLHRRLS